MSACRAILLAVVYVSLFILATPGIDSLGIDRLTKADRQKLIREGTPVWLLDLGMDIGQLRRLLLKPLTPLQRPLRIEQSWGLYGQGQSRVRRMEVYLEDALVYRSGDPEHDWMEPMFRNRRLRPMVDTVSRKPSAKNRNALMSLIAQRATDQNPELAAIEVRFTIAKFPGTESRTAHAFRMRTPDWEPERL